MKKEIWKDIFGYEGLYQVSTYGRIRSCDKIVNYVRYGVKLKRKRKSRIRKQGVNLDGYMMCILSKNGKRHPRLSHRYVAEAFIPNPLNKETVNHKDKNRANNHINNLEWNTRKENSIHSWVGRKMDIEHQKRMVALIVKPVICYDDFGNKISEYESITAAAKGVGRSARGISYAIKGVYKKSAGYIWKYKNNT